MKAAWLVRLSLARTASQFCGLLEELAQELVGVEAARYYSYDAEAHELVRAGDEPTAVSEATHPGACATLREVVRGTQPVPGLADGGATLSIPVRHYGSLVGVLTTRPPSDVETLQELAEVAGVVQDLVMRREELELFRERTQDLVVQAVEAVSQWGKGHVGKVARVASELAALLDFSAQSRQEIFQAAHHHDVGYLVLPNPTGFEARQAHPQVGAAFLAASRSLKDLAPLVQAHHERYDGSGFPCGAAGDDLPLEAWVLALAEDVVECWAESLCEAYRDRVAEFFDQRAPSHHPEAVDALCGLVDSGRLQEILE